MGFVLGKNADTGFRRGVGAFRRVVEAFRMVTLAFPIYDKPFPRPNKAFPMNNTGTLLFSTVLSVLRSLQHHSGMRVFVGSGG